MDREKKFDILTEGQKYGVSMTCSKYGISRTLYYRWLRRYKTFGLDGLDAVKKSFVPINKTPEPIEARAMTLIKRYPTYGPREIKYLLEEIGHDISESAVYNMMKRHNLSTKDKRLKFAKKKNSSQTINLPNFDAMKSGDCWLFWTTYYGNPKNLGPLYEYTLFDYKSKMACSRLYDTLSLECFEDLLTAVAIPVAQSLNFNTHYLCYFEDFKLPETIALSGGFDLTLYQVKEDAVDSIIINLKKEFTHHCLAYLTPFVHSERSCSMEALKILLQRHIRNYNLHHKSYYGELEFSPIEYHSYATGGNRILPLWAYIDRMY